jgi:alkylated DNA nucleotide flippase Atl1
MAAGRTLPPGRVVTFEEIGDIVGVGDYLAVERDLAR